jgi:hypothetical protein
MNEPLSLKLFFTESLVNRSVTTLTIVREPWGDEFELPPGSTLIIRLYLFGEQICDTANEGLIVVNNNRIIISSAQRCYIALAINGTDVTDYDKD